MTKIKILVKNAITNEEVINNVVEIKDYDFEIMDANANAFSDTFADCCVTFSANNGDFVCLPARNQMIDDVLVETGIMTFDEYMEKWYTASI
jgi:hypothetical protein